ncbi:alpha-ketoacid dehydrogenase subunit beta [Ammoniphilus sp. YIM 78166]|uniref:alpha-ketoacid dehydrogenase subunit beta n=1 Tax=Ammoniphilus sp. YIM 78166 TaxID=1644106 RepID=UPI00106F866E|nr:alpha-ketoacid dehydrogenase subunit beta [Ammoniphilus sp. YIM 78166]
MQKMTYTQALNLAIREEMERNDRVVLFGEDIGKPGGAFKVTQGLWERFGSERVLDTPISETGFFGMAVGAALTGLRPVVEILYMDFCAVAMDQLINQANKLTYMSGGQFPVPVVFRGQQGAGRGNGAQHSQSFESLFCNMPGIEVVLPSSPNDAYGLFKTAVRNNKPVIFLEHKLLYGIRGEVEVGQDPIPFGKANIVRRGEDVTIVAVSRMVELAKEAAANLEQIGISCEIIDPRTLVPFDLETVKKSVQKTGRLVVVEESHKWGSIGTSIIHEVVEQAFDYLDAPPKLVGTENVPIPYSKPLEDAAIPSVPKIESAVQSLV